MQMPPHGVVRSGMDWSMTCRHECSAFATQPIQPEETAVHRGRGYEKTPMPEQGGECRCRSRIPYLADHSAGIGTLRSFLKKRRRLPGFTGPIPSTSLDKASSIVEGNSSGLPGVRQLGTQKSRMGIAHPALLCGAQFTQDSRLTNGRWRRAQKRGLNSHPFAVVIDGDDVEAAVPGGGLALAASVRDRETSSQALCAQMHQQRQQARTEQ